MSGHGRVIAGAVIEKGGLIGEMVIFLYMTNQIPVWRYEMGT